jgi:hypothetical protein
MATARWIEARARARAQAVAALRDSVRDARRAAERCGADFAGEAQREAFGTVADLMAVALAMIDEAGTDG